MADRTRLDLSVLLPDVPDADDRCVERLAAGISALEGVEQSM